MTQESNYPAAPEGSVRLNKFLASCGYDPGGEESLRRQEYYAFPRNAFWRIMGELFGFSRDLPYAERLSRLGENGVALWDVLASCRREGSLDTKISDPVPNDIAGLLERNPGITHIFCNGSASFLFLKRYHGELFRRGISIVRLPSTSPAAAALPYREKFAAYSVIAEIVKK